MKRRQFFYSFTAAVAQAAVLAAAAESAPRLSRMRQKHFPKGLPGMIPILDTHQHLWDLGRFKLPWLSTGPLAQNHLMSDYLAAAEGLNITRTIYMEVDVDPSQKTEEAEYVIGLCSEPDNPMAAAVIGALPGKEGFKEYIGRFKDIRAVKGVRQVLPGGGDRPFWLEEDFVKDIRLLGECGLRFDLCIPADSLLQGARLVDECPGTRFILDHCGNANVQLADLSSWKQGIEALSKRPNTVCKISGIVASARPGQWSPGDLAPVIHHCAETFGRERIFFGSDWPVCTRTSTLRQWIEALQQIVQSWPKEDRRKLFNDNAARFYDVGTHGSAGA